MSGNISFASAGEISCSGSPNAVAQPICRRISAIRSGDDASRMPPDSTQPTGCSPCCSCRYSSTEYMFIRVSVGSARSCPTSPAEWNVEPLVRSARSTSTTSVRPSSARWYATLAPPTPPPMTTTDADVGNARPVGCSDTSGD